MFNYFLYGLDYRWDLIRETSSSQKYIVDVGGHRGLKAAFDIHYTKPEIVYVTVCLIGPKEYFTGGLSRWLFADLEKIIKRHGDYHVIDYVLVFSDHLCDGNYSIM